MPLINGQKMACEPCIRGHRSTKCTHANERLMVPVRKPGRPLSACPHPPSRPCSCDHVTAAIPKKQKCHCGTKGGGSSQAKPGEDSGKESTPQSPPKANGASFRVQKTPKGGNSSRKQSVDAASLERMDPNQFNIMTSNFNPMTPRTTPPLNGAVPAIPGMSAYGAMAMAPSDGPFGPIMFPMFQPPMPPPMMSPDAMKGIASGHSLSIPAEAPSNQPDREVPKMGSCCGGGGGGGGGISSSAPPITESSTTTALPNGGGENNPKSCCSSSISSPKIEQKAESIPPSDAPTSNGMMMSPFGTPMMMPNGMYPFYPQPTVFTYPPHYGSFMQPLQPEQWRQMMASMAFSHGAVPSPYGIPGAMPFQPPSTPQSAAGISHQCTCGDSCQCIGCAAHPYNEATQNYVRSAWEIMREDSQNQGHVHHARSNGATGSPAMEALTNGNVLPATSCLEGTKSPTAPQTPSDAASGVSEEQALSASDFFFVSYPFGDSCAGEMASCPCGDDCQCLGCVIHNNPDPAAETT